MDGMAAAAAVVVTKSRRVITPLPNNLSLPLLHYIVKGFGVVPLHFTITGVPFSCFTCMGRGACSQSGSGSTE